MTCIIGLLNNGNIYMGVDSIVFSDTFYQIRKDEKVFFLNDKFIISFTGSFRIGQILRYNFKPPFHPIDMDDMHYMCTLFVDSVMDCLVEKGAVKTESGIVGSEELEFLVGYNKQIYHIQQDFQVGINSMNFISCGCGRDY